MSDLGVNEHHMDQILSYMRFAKYQRAQRIKAVDGNFEDLKDSRLVEDTYTSDEIAEMLAGLQAVVRGEVETELLNMAHTNALLLRQLFNQAEKWHLKLQADISELENRDLLEAVKEFENKQFSMREVGTPFSPKHKKLEPLNEGGGAALLQLEIERLTGENEKLRNRFKALETQTSLILEDKSKLTAGLDRTTAELQQMRSSKPEAATAEVSDLEKKVASVKMEMEKHVESTKADNQVLATDLVTTKHRLLEVQEQLEMAEKELERKFSKTAAYASMKKILAKKNEQVKDLRKALSKYETLDDLPVE